MLSHDFQEILEVAEVPLAVLEAVVLDCARPVRVTAVPHQVFRC